jgi:glutaredoxin
MDKKINLELYYFDACPFCQLVLNKIKQLKLSSFVEYKDIMSDTSARQKLIADTGRQTVPCLYIDNNPMHESRDICHWLESNVDLILGAN